MPRLFLGWFFNLTRRARFLVTCLLRSTGNLTLRVRKSSSLRIPPESKGYHTTMAYYILLHASLVLALNLEVFLRLHILYHVTKSNQDTARRRASCRAPGCTLCIVAQLLFHWAAFESPRSTPACWCLRQADVSLDRLAGFSLHI